MTSRPAPPLSRIVPVLLPFVLGAIVACGGDAQDAAPGDGDGNTSGDGDAPGDGDGDSVCDALENDSPRQLEIEIRNERSTTVFIGPRQETCGSLPPFDVEDADGHLLETHFGDCFPPCEGYVAGEEAACLDICLYPEIITIEPGESHLAIWDTRFSEYRDLPAACNHSEDLATNCVRAKAIEAGTFTILARAGTESECAFSCSDCPEDDACLGHTIVAGEELEARTTVFLDESYGIYPVTRGGDAPTPGAVNSVELVFTE